MKCTQILSMVARALVGIVLLYAGFAKLSDFEGFVTNLSLYGLMPMPIVHAVSYACVSAEMVLGMSLI